MDWDALINEAHALNEKHGTNIKGKRYSTVATRVELFRRWFGDSFGVETEIVSLGKVKGEPVVVRAIIRNGDRIVSTGHAAEVIGSTNINATSALENCETSAIGRALAGLGIHGGEMASLDELRPKAEAPAKPPAQAPVVPELPPDIEPNLPDFVAWCRDQHGGGEGFHEYVAKTFAALWERKPSEGQLRNAWDKNKASLEWLERMDRKSHSDVIDAFETRMQVLTDNHTRAAE
jgi:hypothetical protein